LSVAEDRNELEAAYHSVRLPTSPAFWKVIAGPGTTEGIGATEDDGVGTSRDPVVLSISGLIIILGSSLMCCG
jgi:hypothetical protein